MWLMIRAGKMFVNYLVVIWCAKEVKRRGSAKPPDAIVTRAAPVAFSATGAGVTSPPV